MNVVTKCSLFLIFFTVKIGFSQSSQQYHRTYSDSMPLAYRIDHSILRENTFLKFPDNFSTERRRRACYEFSDELAMYVANDMESGLVYSDWMDFENYLNKIAKLVIPEEMIKKELIHIYIRKDGEINAASAPSGAIFFNVGMLPLLKSESAIAAIIAHEVAHFHFNHVIQSYLNEITHKFDYVLFKDIKSRNKFNVNNELQADSMGMIWMLNAGYSIDGMIEAHNMLQRHEKNTLRKIESKFKMEETTHPSSERRLNKINEFISKHQLTEGRNFIQSEALFNELKSESKNEVLNSFIESHNYQGCIENAFMFHLFEPDNSIFISYLLEGIRRYCYFDKSRWNKNFITDKYYVKVDNEGHKKKVPM